MQKRLERKPNDHFPKVLEDFASYEAFRLQKKRVLENPIQMKEKASKSLVFVGKSGLSDSPETTHFEAEICEFDALKYSIKVFCTKFGGQPCLRFDSRGGDHINEEDGSGLFARIVPCPHFHRVREDGWLWAYHTPDLADPIKASEVALDVSFGRDLACAEFNVTGTKGNDLVLFKKAATMKFKPSSGALDGAQFP